MGYKRTLNNNRKWGMSIRSTIIEKLGMSVRSTLREKWGMSVRSTVIESNT